GGLRRADRQAGTEGFLGRLFGLFCRSGWAPVGGCLQPVLSARCPRARIAPGRCGDDPEQRLMAHDSYSDDLIASILRENTSIAMVGASANTSRPSYFAMKYLLGKGYTVVPVNVGLAGQRILG